MIASNDEQLELLFSLAPGFLISHVSSLVVFTIRLGAEPQTYSDHSSMATVCVFVPPEDSKLDDAL